MNKIITLLLTSLFFIQCASVKEHNAHLNDLIPAAKLHEDVDYTYNKLQKMHPNLYWYIAKKDLDYKFDSLKTTIREPLTSFDFYKKLSPVVSSIGQGHLILFPNQRKFTKKETAAITKKGVDPISQFEFEIFNDKLYIIKNKSNNKDILPGTEVLSMNNKQPSNFIKEYSTYFASDGYNKTFKKNRIAKSLKMFYTFENGLQDSIVYNLKWNDVSKLVVIKRDTVATAKKKAAMMTTKEMKKAVSKKKLVEGFDKDSKTYTRNLRFMEKDSAIAIISIKGFKNGDYNTFYKESFKKIKAYQSKTLIIDLRNNSGGRMSEIANLYSYLADTSFVFSDKYEVVSKTSLFKADYFKTGGVGLKVFKTIISPIYYGFTFFKVHKNRDGKYYYSPSQSKLRKVKDDAFKGKVYVLINGGSFSASSVISSNLKGAKRAYFVGEETGGAYNGTVAGMMPLEVLPNSKIKARIGLMVVRPHYKTNVEGRGVFPDTEIIPTLEDRIESIDPEMEWILNDLKK
jgi:C-terminal processing protease CtpA/Prc